MGQIRIYPRIAMAAVVGVLASGAIVGKAALAAPVTECTALQFCYCVETDLRDTIRQRVATIRAAIAEQRQAGKAIAYISVPISTLEGSYFGVNIEAAAAIKLHVEAQFGTVWALNPGDKAWSLPRAAKGADYMLMWTEVLEGAGAVAPDFDFIYFVGPSDFARFFKLDGNADLLKIEAYYDARAQSDAEIKKIDRTKFRNYYGLRASVAFSLGAHDEWNLVRAINEKRRAMAGGGIASQLAVFFDGKPIAPALYETAIAAGNMGACK